MRREVEADIGDHHRPAKQICDAFSKVFVVEVPVVYPLVTLILE